MVAAPAPPPSRVPRPRWYSVEEGRRLKRIWDPGERGWAGDAFRTGEPRYRFDHHVPDEPQRGIMYAGFTLSCCVVEKFGDVGAVECGNNRFCELDVTQELRLLDLRGAAAEAAGTVAAIGSVVDVSLTQQWADYFYRTFEKADGLIYTGAHNAEDAIALFERAAGKVRLRKLWPLNDRELRYAILEACDDNNMVFIE